MMTDGWQFPYSLNLQFCFWQNSIDFMTNSILQSQPYLSRCICKNCFRKHTVCQNTPGWETPCFPRRLQRGGDSACSCPAGGGDGELFFFQKRQARRLCVSSCAAADCLKKSHGKSRRDSLCGAARIVFN